MTRFFHRLFFTLSVVTSTEVSANAEQFSYSNPLDFSYTDEAGHPQRELRDPCIIHDGDTYYLIFTMHPFRAREEQHLSEPNMGGSPGIRLYSSKDLKTWKEEKWLVKSSDLPDDAPYKHRFWAPEIHKIAGSYYLIFTADNWLKNEYNPAGRWGTAGYAFIGVADKITGPYEHITYLDGAACDTTLAESSDGQVYAVIPKNSIFVRKLDLSHLKQGVVKLVGEEKLAVARENKDIGVTDNPAYLEGPWVERIGARYYLFHAAFYRNQGAPGANEYWTNVAYADDPMGPWKKDARAKLFEGGHLAVFDGPDKGKWFSYRIENKAQPRGLLAIDPFKVDATGAIQPRPPSVGPQSAVIPPP